MANDNDDPKLLEQRKLDHILLCAEEDVESRARTTLLEQVAIAHRSLPEISVDEIDMSTEIHGKRVALPLMVSGMTGGTPKASKINRDLARVAQRMGMMFGLGSQRAMMRDPRLTETYAVRDVAPDVLICGNIGVVQAAESSTAELQELAGAIDADFLCVHLNPAQEIVQDHGDRDFRGCVDALARLVEELPIPVIAKETGGGMSPQTLDQLCGAGVSAVDVSGAGGTTWVGVEALRGSPVAASIGDVLWDWGVPTAASVVFAHRRGLDTIASGGIRNGLDAARALALGANVASAALPYLRAAFDGGYDAAIEVATVMRDTVRAVMLLTGSKNLAELRAAPRITGATLDRWLELDHV